MRVRLNRPDRRNAFDAALLASLRAALEAPSEPIIVLGSTDRRVFSAGGDLSLPRDELSHVSDGLYALYEQVLRLPNVVIAAADGHAVGAGAQLLLCTDLRIGGEGLRISFAGAATGLSLGTWGLPGLVGRGRALDLSLTGRTVESREALAMGLLDRIEPDPDTAAVKLAVELSGADPDALASVKHLVIEAGLVDALRAERRANAERSHVASGSFTSRPGRRS